MGLLSELGDVPVTRICRSARRYALRRAPVPGNLHSMRLLLKPPVRVSRLTLIAAFVAAAGPLLQACGSDGDDVVPYSFGLDDVDESASSIELLVTHSCSLPSLQAHVGESGTSVNILLTGVLTECGEQGAQEERMTINLRQPIGDRSIIDLSCDLGDVAVRCDRRND